MSRMDGEREFNQLINQIHSFGDPALLRRELYLKGWIDRTIDGGKYRASRNIT